MSKHLDNFNKANPGHIKNDIKMQVHHLISKASMNHPALNGKGKIIKDKGYDIDSIDNLVALPNEYQGACHLEVQLHRSNHTNADKTKEGHPISYHKRVASIVNEHFSKPYPSLDQYCDSRKLQKKMNDISSDILRLIKKFRLSLTKKEISDCFKKDNEEGCRQLKLGEGIRIFEKHEVNNLKCSMENRSGKRGKHFKDIKKYTLKVGY